MTGEVLDHLPSEPSAFANKGFVGVADVLDGDGDVVA